MNRTLVLAAALAASHSLGNDMSFRIQSGRIQSGSGVEIVLSGSVPSIPAEDISFSDGLALLSAHQEGNRLFLKTSPVDLRKNYRVRIRHAGERELLADGLLDSLFSEKPLGCVREAGGLAFRVFAPRALSVKLALYGRVDDADCRLAGMTRDSDGVWEAFLPDPLPERWYGYRISGPSGEAEMFLPGTTVADPYGRALATRNTYLHEARTLIPDDRPFDWQGDRRVTHAMEDLILYEMHVRDMTAHPSAGLDPSLRGTYAGLV
ncbi:hypothetical protein JW777_01735, partial [bacterium]|nr:hypothetical protein [bacterium]